MSEFSLAPSVVFSAFFFFILFLFAVALWAEKSPIGRRWADSSWAYCLALGVYCTSWTFYGSVGSVVHSGPMFLAVYLGPTLALFFALGFLRRLQVFASKYRTGNLADFVAATYGGSQWLGMLVTLMALISITPYIALQIKSVIATFHLLMPELRHSSANVYVDEAMVALLILMTIVFGLRSRDTTERHRGVTLLLAVQSLVKLSAFLACGLFVTYGLFDGVHDVLQRYAQAQADGWINLPRTAEGAWYVTFSTWLLLSMAAFVFLPHMFQVLVLESVVPDHLRTAMWLFPLFLLLLNLFVLPIAAAGLVLGGIPANADTFVLSLPINAGAEILALFVFFGGFSAAMGMVLVAAMSLSTMASNYFLLPLADTLPLGSSTFIRRYLRPARWLIATLLIYGAYLFQLNVDATRFLVSIGLVSFAGLAQLLPAVVGGLLWSRGSRGGAIVGLGVGFLLWGYTLLLPLVAHSNPFLFSFTAEHLFGMQSLPPLAHGVFWSLLANTFCYILFSLLFSEHRADRTLASLLPSADQSVPEDMAQVRLSMEKALQDFLDAATVASLLSKAEDSAGVKGHAEVSPLEVARYLAEAETCLAAFVGSASAHKIFSAPDVLDPQLQQRVRQAYGNMLADLRVSPEELRQRVDYFAQRTAALQRSSDELKTALEAARLANLAKDQFLANISHELRTPLNAVIGLSDLAQRAHPDPTQAEFLNKISRAGKSLSGIINDLLDLSKISAGRLDFESVTFSLRLLLERCREMMEHKALDKKLQLVFCIDPNVPDILVGDPLRLNQILFNLLSNAIKFTVAGSVRLHVRVGPSQNQRVCLEVEVEDTGIGMSEDDITRLFKAFSQADASMSRRYGGSGLGLAISKRLAEMMGGDIGVKSELGEGTIFRLVIWLTRGKPEDVVEDVAVSTDAQALTHYLGACALVVDDQDVNREIVKGLLAVVGVASVGASNGQEALDELLKVGPKAFDIVLMDIQMPEMDGLTATRLLRTKPGFQTLPVIAMSAHSMQHEQNDSLAAGMNGHLGKPFDAADFFRLLEQWIPAEKHLSAPRLAQDAVSKPPVVIFPPLRGIDTVGALSRFAGKPANYQHWLMVFVEEAGGVIEDLRQLLASEQAEAARKLVHSFKGRVGMLGMNQLHALVLRLESAIIARQSSSELIAQIEQEIAVLCEELQRVLDLPVSFKRSSTPQMLTRPALPLPESIVALIALLEAADGDSELAIEQCLQELGSTPWAPHLKEALVFAQRFEFDAAKACFTAPAAVAL